MLSDAYLHEGYIILAIDYFTVHINVSYITWLTVSLSNSRP